MKCTSTRGKGTREIFITAVQTEQFLDIETCRSVDISCTACCQKHIVGLLAQQLTQIQPSSGSKKLVSETMYTIPECGNKPIDDYSRPEKFSSKFEFRTPLGTYTEHRGIRSSEPSSIMNFQRHSSQSARVALTQCHYFFPIRS